MTPEEKLNFILRFYATISGRLASFGNLSSRFSGKEIRDDAELSQIVDRLDCDKFILSRGEVTEKYDGCESITTLYSLTFEGERFIENNGYVQQKKDTERIRKKDNLNIWAITVGGVGAYVSIPCLLYPIIEKELGFTSNFYLFLVFVWLGFPVFVWIYLKKRN